MRSSPRYGRDLAWIHHKGFGDFAREAAPGLLALLARAGVSAGRLVDLGCGSGIWLRTAGRAGFEAIGVEPSREFLALARARAPRAILHRASAYNFRFPACDAVTAMGEVLSYCPPGRAPSLSRLFARVSRALRPGGVLVFDLLVESRGAPMDYRTWRAGAGWACLIDVREDRGRRRLRREITTFRRARSGYRKGHETHLLRVAVRREVERSLRAAGFSVRITSRYGAFELPPRRLAFVARKRW